jgi:molybdenum cofactor biosynthesis enzyme
MPVYVKLPCPEEKCEWPLHLKHASAYASIRQHTPAYVRAQTSRRQLQTSYLSIRQHTIRQNTSAYDTSAYVSERQHTSSYVSIRRQHTSAYVSIRQHMSAYVSIRQHTSAYVSIRQHTRRRGKTGVETALLAVSSCLF